MRYAARRLVQAPFLIVLLLTLNFGLIQAAPGDPLAIYLGGESASADYVEALRERFGLDRPVVTQYVTYVRNVATLDLGFSIRFQEDVLPLILNRLPATLLLAGAGLLISIVGGVLLGIYAARRGGSPVDGLATVGSVGLQSIPAFWLGQLLILLFAYQLGWFPVEGMGSARESTAGLGAVVDLLRHLVLPAFATGALFLALVYRLTRSKLIENLRLDYVTAARAKGLDEDRVVYRHALPNSLLPLFTVVALNVGLMLSSTILIERVFAWPGVGLLMFDAIAARDFPLLLGIFTVIATMVILVALLADLAYRLLDPRIRLT